MSSEPQQPESLEEKYDLIEMRRAKIIRLLHTRISQTQIAESLGVDKSTISRDIKEMKEAAKEGMKDYVTEVLPFEHAKTIAAFDEVIGQAWTIAAHYKEDPRVMLSALNVISDALMKRQQVLGDPQYIERAIRKVAEIKRTLELAKNKQFVPVVATDQIDATAKPENAALDPKQETVDDDPVLGIVIEEEDTTAP